MSPVHIPLGLLEHVIERPSPLPLLSLSSLFPSPSVVGEFAQAQLGLGAQLIILFFTIIVIYSFSHTTIVYFYYFIFIIIISCYFNYLIIFVDENSKKHWIIKSSNVQLLIKWSSVFCFFVVPILSPINLICLATNFEQVYLIWYLLKSAIVPMLWKLIVFFIIGVISAHYWYYWLTIID